MSTLVQLVGEQPIPNLLPARWMKPTRTLLVATKRTRPVADRLMSLIAGAEVFELDNATYDLPRADRQLRELLPDADVVFNLTGGTKIMSLAAYNVAITKGATFMYLESEGHRSRLHRWQVSVAGRLTSKGEVELDDLITADDYLRAHLPGYVIHGPSTKSGGAFEIAVGSALKSAGFEVLAGVRPNGVAEQIELDLVIRHKNQVGIAEVKMGGEERPKQGIDQLGTASSREYLGTYTERFLILAKQPNAAIRELAKEKKVTVIVLDYDGSPRPGQLSKPLATKLCNAVSPALGRIA